MQLQRFNCFFKFQYDTHPVGTLRVLLSDPSHDFFHEEPSAECCVNKSKCCKV